jgi:hypothetical protein
LSVDRERQEGPLHDVYFWQEFAKLLRTPDHPMQAGNRIELPGMTAEVIKVDGKGMPTEVSFEFAASLNDPSFCWLWCDYDKHQFLPWEVPAVGQSLYIPGAFE